MGPPPGASPATLPFAMDLFAENLPLGPGTVGALAYKLLGPEGAVLEAISKDSPLLFLFGTGVLVPGLERALAGKLAGTTERVEVSAADGYGEHDPDKVFYVPRSQFPEGELEPGAMMGATTAEGEEVTFWITAVEGERVIVNENHPLAGVPLVYEAELVGVRSATEEERQAGRLIEPGA